MSLPSAAWGTVKAVCDSLRRQVSDMQEESRPWADQLPRRAARRAPGLPCPQPHLLPPEAEAHSNSAAPSSLLLRTGAAEPRRHHQHHNSDLFSTKFTILLLPKRWAANTCVYCETKPNLVILFFSASAEGEENCCCFSEGELLDSRDIWPEARVPALQHAAERCPRPPATSCSHQCAQSLWAPRW